MRNFCRHASAFLVVFALLAGAATAAAATEVDPWQGANRKVFAFNDRADRWILKPVAQTYERITPKFLQRGVRNVFRNIGTPMVALNQLLQGKGRMAASDTARFVLNTTVGIGGLFDPAAASGLRAHEEDFGQTLRVWGFGNGPFLMIPFRGPGTTTHAVGMLVESFANPLRLISPERDRYITYAVYFVDQRAALLASEKLVSGDKYLFLRDAYLQRRDFLVSDGAMEEDPFLDDFEDE